MLSRLLEWQSQLNQLIERTKKTFSRQYIWATVDVLYLLYQGFGLKLLICCLVTENKMFVPSYNHVFVDFTNYNMYLQINLLIHFLYNIFRIWARNTQPLHYYFWGILILLLLRKEKEYRQKIVVGEKKIKLKLKKEKKKSVKVVGRWKKSVKNISHLAIT